MNLPLLANENLPYASVLRLRELGFDVLAIAENHASISDRKVIKIAQQEGRIIVTFDRDYGELIFRHRVATPPGVIYLRFVPHTPVEASQVLERFFRGNPLNLLGNFLVLTRDTIRVKPLSYQLLA